MTRDQIQTVLDALQGYQPYAQVGTQVRQKTDESIAILQAALAEPSEPVAEVAGDYNTKHIIFLPAGIALEVGDKLFTHPASKPELPYDVVVGGNTFRKGVSLDTFVMAAKRWHKDAYPMTYELSQEQKDANLNALLLSVAQPSKLGQGVDPDDFPACGALYELKSTVPEQEPVGMTATLWGGQMVTWASDIPLPEGTKLFTHPASKVEPLTDEEIFSHADTFGAFQYGDAQGDKRLAFARAIEQAVWEKMK